MRISDWSSDVCSSDLLAAVVVDREAGQHEVTDFAAALAGRSVEDQRPARGDGIVELLFIQCGHPGGVDVARSQADDFGLIAARSEGRRVGKGCVRTF